MKVEQMNGNTDQIAKLHEESGFNYTMPNVLTPLFPIRRVVYGERGELVAAAFVKVEAEVYLIMDHNYGTPAERWEAVQLINADLKANAARIGFDSLYCVLPPEIAKSFGARLVELGWERTRDWPRFTLEVRK